jgi:hypothetical protein
MVEVGGGPNKTASLCLLFHATLNQPKMWSSNPTQTKHYNHSLEHGISAWQPMLHTHTKRRNCFPPPRLLFDPIFFTWDLQ